MHIKDGQDYPYGHLALRVNTQGKEYVYDYGRYGRTRGIGNSEGEGILRIWKSFNKYIASENALGRKTTGFIFSITDNEANRIIKYFESFIYGAVILREYKNTAIYYKTLHDYHALASNCTTVAFDGAKLAISNIDIEQESYIKGNGLGVTERFAAKAVGWPKRIFMPADVENMLRSRQILKPDKTNRYP